MTTAATTGPVADRRLREGKLEQTCTACGRMEAAGSHCTRCLRVMDPGDWYRNGDMQARQDRAGMAPATPPKRPPSRPSRASGPLTLELAP
jgi:hypothetical protein